MPWMRAAVPTDKAREEVVNAGPRDSYRSSRSSRSSRSTATELKPVKGQQ